MLIHGSESTTEGELLMQLWNATSDETCTELEWNNVEFDPAIVSAMIDILPQKDYWDSIRITNCHGGAIVNDVIMAICTNSTNTPITSFSLQQTISSVDATTFYAITYGLKYAKHWRHLSLAVQTIDVDASNQMARALARNTWLETLDLAGSVLSNAAISPLSFGLRLNRTLKKLRLDGCGLQDDQMATVLLALQDHPTLKSLSIQQNLCHDKGMGAIAALLHYNELEELDMSYLLRKKKEPQPEPAPEEPQEDEAPPEEDTDQPKDDGGGDETSKDQTEDETPKEDETNAEEETAEENPPEEPEVKEEEETQKVHNTTLKSLQLAGNFLPDGFIDGLFNIFGPGSTLEELNLFGNRISDAGVAKILRKIPYLQHLKTLFLGQNFFSTAAAQEIVTLMKTNYTLQDVNIRSLDSPELDDIQEKLDYYCRLNRGGRRIFAKAKLTVPLSLWPIIMERAHKIHWGASTNNTMTNIHSHAAEAIYCLLQGPAIFENPGIVFS